MGERDGVEVIPEITTQKRCQTVMSDLIVVETVSDVRKVAQRDIDLGRIEGAG